MTRDVNIYERDNNQVILKHKMSEVSALSKSIHSKGTTEAKYQRLVLDLRQNLLRSVEKEIVRSETQQRSIFISYSAVGGSLGKTACEIASEHGLFPKTGFDSEVQIGPSKELGGYGEGGGLGQIILKDQESLPRRIMAHILSCNCFLGIWTEDFDAENKDTVDYLGNAVPKYRGFVPSVWMPFELGVAAAHDIPFRLLVVKGTHRHYYEKPFNYSAQIVFERHEFPAMIKKVISYLANKLERRDIAL